MRKNLFVSLWLSGQIGLPLSVAAQPGITRPKPNIIFLFTDDHRWDALGAMGNSIIQTPNLDALARKGGFIQKRLRDDGNLLRESSQSAEWSVYVPA